MELISHGESGGAGNIGINGKADGIGGSCDAAKMRDEFVLFRGEIEFMFSSLQNLGQEFKIL